MSLKKILIIFIGAVAVLVLVGIAVNVFVSRGADRPSAETPSGTIPQQATTTNSKYCLNGRCWEDNSTSVFQELFGERLDAIASNDPGAYGGSVISGFYSDDRWLTACQPLKQKVMELVSGKATDREKILAIANWVTKSRPYGGSGFFDSVCELFGGKTGVCADAAALTTSMFRIAGLPARVVDPKTNGELAAHEYTAVFLDGKWVAVDTTFGGGERKIFESTAILSGLTYHEFDKPREIVVPAFDNPYNVEFSYYLADGIFSLNHIQSNVITDGGVTKVQPYGTISYIKPRYYSEGTGYIGNATLIANDLQCDYYECKKSAGAKTKILLPQSYTMIKASKLMHVVDGKIGQEINDELTTTVDLIKDYQVLATYPAGSYRFIYESEKIVAYYDFELPSFGSIEIAPDKLVKGADVSNVDFEKFIAYLKGVD